MTKYAATRKTKKIPTGRMRYWGRCMEDGILSGLARKRVPAAVKNPVKKLKIVKTTTLAISAGDTPHSK
jgi:hypothetical protein